MRSGLLSMFLLSLNNGRSTPIAVFVKRLRCRRCGSIKVSWRRASLRTGRKEPRDVWAFHRQSRLRRNHRPLSAAAVV